MSSQGLEIKLPEPLQVAQTIATIAQKSQRLVGNFLRRQVIDGALDLETSLSIGKAFLELTQKMMLDPTRLAQAQMSLWQEYTDLWRRSAAAFFGQQVEPLSTPEENDRRFKHDVWQDNYLFDFIKQAYLLTARWLQGVVSRVEKIDPKTKRKIEFYTRQFVDAMAPTNFPLTNPEVLRATIESGGANLLQGLSNLLTDLERGRGKLAIRTTDLQAFKPGVNVAATPGKVIFQNELMQLIQYLPVTEQVFQRPILMVPPWINKFYILDLRPKNSFVKWWTEQGFTVFLISWVNPDKTLAEKTFEDYLLQGPVAALDVIEQATGESEVNCAGYCLGGTLLAAMAAYLTSLGYTDRIHSCTFFTTILDFSEPGELEVFIDEEQLSALEKRMERRGYLEGSEMAATFSLLRANDLIWAFFINNYLLGREPFPFDLLYWNSDSTRMPAKMHSFYLRNMYQRNLLREPGGIALAGVPIDLSKIQAPAYFLATIEDHIAPWKTVYAGSRLLSGPVHVALSGSGHIAGVINPPVSNKYCYWTNSTHPETPELWLGSAERHEGSWWVDWRQWIESLTGPSVPARIPGAGRLPVIEDAPGSYVKVRLLQ
ncbi:MAG: class I poly(R)-hydroxyalkanoic acid synthase [Candidatus Competibacteraceae bacterium]